jgi:hypothetical protein
MGICCSSQNSQTTAVEIDPRKVRENYSPDAELVVDPSNEKATLPFLEEELVLGTKNNGWICDGHVLLKGGCSDGCGKPFNSYMVKAYFST